jgi:outer membrane protein
VAPPAGTPATTPPAAAPAGPVGPALSLDEALVIARRSNPTLQQSVNQRRRSSAQMRSAYGALVPNISTGFGSSYREGRPQFFAGQQIGASSDQIASSVSASADARYDVATFNAPRLQRANAEAVEADVSATEQSIRTGVTQQYLAALAQQARAELQDTLVATAASQLELARARVAVGAATVLDVRRAEVALGQAQVNQIQARNLAEVEKLRLFQQMGAQQPPDVRLTSRFEVSEPNLTLPDLLDQARRGNPNLNALRSRERVSDVTVKSARGDYLPSLQLSARVSGFTNEFVDADRYVAGQRANALRSTASCFSQDSLRVRAGLPSIANSCAESQFTDATAAELRSANSTFPFQFTRNPYELSAFVSLPIFNGFQREQRVQEAIANRNDAEYRRRAQELQLTADVTSTYLTLQAQQRAVALQQQNANTAREALQLAQERYRVGANSFIDVAQSRDDYVRATTDYINAVYEFHRAFAALENAVGRPLR